MPAIMPQKWGKSSLLPAFLSLAEARKTAKIHPHSKQTTPTIEGAEPAGSG